MFTKIIESLLDDDEYHKLQIALIKEPASGAIIKGSGGIRKLRWNGSGRGKRGGIRVIYYWLTEDEKLFMLYAYPKNQADDLSKSQLSQLKAIVELEVSHERERLQCTD